MILTEQLQAFISDHFRDDLDRLLLSAARYPEIDVSFAASQIAARRVVRDKLPEWFSVASLIYPSRIAAEQCSSERTARYKQRLIGAEEKVCDLTGGLGVDSFYLSKKAKRVTYVERFADYCEAARTNFALLGATHLDVIEGDAQELLPRLTDFDLYYIDPARRGDANKRLFALSACEPDLPALLPQLLSQAPKVIAKLSPMADIGQTLALLPGTKEIHILSVKNECKELLFVIGREETATPSIHCLNFRNEGEETFVFTQEEERNNSLQVATALGTYLYEPNSSILKGGAFKSVAVCWQLKKLETSSHLYTSDRLLTDFPGRTFRIEAAYPFNNMTVKQLKKELPQANLTVRNFPLSVAELRRRLLLSEGGETYLFATTLSPGKKILIKCKKETL